MLSISRLFPPKCLYIYSLFQQYLNVSYFYDLFWRREILYYLFPRTTAFEHTVYINIKKLKAFINNSI